MLEKVCIIQVISQLTDLGLGTVDKSYIRDLPVRVE